MDNESPRVRVAGSDDRYRTLLAISNAIVSNLDKDRLLQAIAEQIKTLLPLDRTAVTLFDPIRDSFRIYLLVTDEAPLYFTQETEIPRQGSAVGWVLDHQQYHFRPDLSEEKVFIEDTLFHKEGLRSVLNLPLVARGAAFGTFNISSKQPACFTAQDIEFLSMVADQIAIAIDNVTAYEKVRKLKSLLDRENLYLRNEIKAEYNFEEIIGKSNALGKVLSRVQMVAETESSVLILGETGTGKELIARAVHNQSKRKARPLIKVNCAALPQGLIESELFGHEKGAFTGALSKKLGRFELADGGTLFLDEIGDLSQDVQSKLLRALQEREFERIGGTTTIKVNVRVIAATNRDLVNAVAEKSFRADLYYRLNVFPIQLPPLRERKGDIPLLAHYFVHKYMIRMGKRFEKIHQEDLDRLEAYGWPGNIRELENVIERATILSTGSVLKIEDELLPTLGRPARVETRRSTLEAVERAHITKILAATDWVIEGPKGAAKILNLHPSTLRSRMQKLEITKTARDIS